MLCPAAAGSCNGIVFLSAGSIPADAAKKAGHAAMASLLAAVAEGRRVPPSREAVIARHAAAEAAERLGSAAAAGITAKVSLAGADSKPPKAAAAGEGKSSTAMACSAPKEEQAAVQALTRRTFYGLGTEGEQEPQLQASMKCRLAASEWEAGWLRQVCATMPAPNNVSLMPLLLTAAGTVPRRGLWLFRLLGVVSQLLGVAYVSWRALRTLRHGWGLALSLPIW